MGKYKTLKELSEALKSGELERGWEIRIDNDSMGLSWMGDYPEDEDLSAAFEEKKYDEGRELWDANIMPNDILEQALTIIGIPFHGA